MVREGCYDHKVNETVNVFTAKTSEIGQRTWGIMKGVMSMATQKVEEFSKEGGRNNDSWQQNESERNGYYREFNQGNKGWNSFSGGRQSSAGQHNSCSSSSWDDWGQKDKKKEETIKETASNTSDGWAGWDDAKDDGFDNFYQSTSDKKAVGRNGKSDGSWTGGGFL